MVLYMTYWFPAATRARFIALFLAGVPLANVIGSPISSSLAGARWPRPCRLAVDDRAGRHSRRCFAALPRLWVLPDGPAKANWLSEDEKRIIAARLAAEPKRRAAWPAGTADRPPHLDPDDPGFLHRVPALCAELLPAADGAWHGLFDLRDRLHRGAALSSGDGRDGGAGLVQRQKRQSRRPCRLRRFRWRRWVCWAR